MQAVLQLLAVGPDVLDRRGADLPGHAAERLYASQAALHAGRHEGIPRQASLRPHPRARPDPLKAERGADRVEDQPGHARVGDDHIAAPAEHADRPALGLGPRERGLKTREI